MVRRPGGDFKRRVTHGRAARDGPCSKAMTLSGALVVGGIGFVGGFFGPMIFAPEANQGPLLGLFITGPLRTRKGDGLIFRGK